MAELPADKLEFIDRLQCIFKQSYDLVDPLRFLLLECFGFLTQQVGVDDRYIEYVVVTDVRPIGARFGLLGVGHVLLNATGA